MITSLPSLILVLIVWFWFFETICFLWKLSSLRLRVRERLGSQRENKGNRHSTWWIVGLSQA